MQLMKKLPLLVLALLFLMGCQAKPATDDTDSDEVFIGRDLAHTRPYGEDVAALIDKEVKDIVDECYVKAKKLISEHMDVLKKSSELLLEKEKISREEFEGLFTDNVTA